MLTGAGGLAAVGSVSVVLCTFRGERFLCRQLQSIVDQSRAVDRIYLVDDQSDDATVHVAEEFLGRLPLAISRNHSRVGAVGNFGRAMALTDEDAVVLCDQDDIWHPLKVERLMSALDQAPCGLLVASDAGLIYESGERRAATASLSSSLGTSSAADWSPSDWMHALLKRNRISGATCAIRRELLDIALPVPEGFWHDEWLALVAAACDGIVWVDDCLTEYRIHDDNAAGLRGTGMTAVVVGAVYGGADHHAAKAAKFELLAAHLRRVGPRVALGRLQQVEAAASFWRRRSALPPSLVQRARFVADTLRADGYATFADGLKSAARDLLGV
jgi:glycosyltransferase involved in cell wall biosynthesis